MGLLGNIYFLTAASVRGETLAALIPALPSAFELIFSLKVTQFLFIYLQLLITLFFFSLYLNLGAQFSVVPSEMKCANNGRPRCTVFIIRYCVSVHNKSGTGGNCSTCLSI